MKIIFINYEQEVPSGNENVSFRKLFTIFSDIFLGDKP